MNIQRILLLLCLFLNICNKVKAQNNIFEKIEYASFDIKHLKKKHKDTIRIDLYSTIDKSGLITILDDDDYHNTLTFGTYQLNTAQLKKINSIFTSTVLLKNYMIRRSFNNDEFFQGTYNFLAVTYKNGKKDSIFFVVPFMSENFQNIYHMLNDIFYDKDHIKKRQPFIIPLNTKNSILSNYKKGNLPKKRSLPSFRLEDQH